MDRSPLGKKDIFSFAGLFAFLFVSLLLFSSSTSPLFQDRGCDSAIFILAGRVVNAGRVPFKDMFDIKGPMIFFVEALGQMLVSGRIGAFILQTLFDSATMLLLYLSARLFLDRGWSIIATGAAFFFFFAALAEGNFTEEYCLLPTVLCLYLALRQLSGDSKKIPPPRGIYLRCVQRVRHMDQNNPRGVDLRHRFVFYLFSPAPKRI